MVSYPSLTAVEETLAEEIEECSSVSEGSLPLGKEDLYR